MGPSPSGASRSPRSVPRALRSAPAQKTPPAPHSTATRSASSRSNSRNASASALAAAPSTALRASGRSFTIVAIAPPRSSLIAISALPPVDLLGGLEHLFLELVVGGAQELDPGERARLRRDPGLEAADHGHEPEVGVDELDLVAEQEVDEQPGGVRMGRALVDRAVEAHVGTALDGHDVLDRQALEVEHVRHRE